MNPVFKLINIMDLTIFQLFGLLGQVIGGSILYICFINHLLKGLKLVASQGIISGFVIRMFYLFYGLIVSPLLLVALLVMTITYPLCMIYQMVLVPGCEMFWTYVDIFTEYTSIIPELIATCFVFVFTRLNDIRENNARRVN